MPLFSPSVLRILHGGDHRHVGRKSTLQARLVDTRGDRAQGRCTELRGYSGDGSPPDRCSHGAFGTAKHTAQPRYGIARGIYERIQEFSAELVGGDLTAGNSIVLSITAVGSLGGSQPPLSLNRARPGQSVIACGCIGYSAAGLDLLKKFGRDHVPVEFLKLVRAHCTPPLMPDRGVVARATGATAMTDNSDGLITDLTTIADRSAVTIELNPAAIEPDHRLLRAAEVLGTDPWKWVLSGGEDHTLLATTTGENVSGFREIGRVIRRGTDPVTIGGEAPTWTEGWKSY